MEGHKRILRLDGVRAVAVLMVFATHTGFLASGWMGVTLFFVLSGYLITGILRGQRTERSFWSVFYAKRAARILPPLVLAFIGAALFVPVAWKKVGIYEFFFLANFSEVFHPGEAQTLGVLWSLAVEEHFYFVWPFAIRFLSRRTLLRLLLVLLVLSPILRAAATPFTSSYLPIYYLTIFQLDGLAAGSLLALLLESDAARRLVKVWSGRLFVCSLVPYILLSFLPMFHREANSALYNSLGYTLIVSFSASFIAYLLMNPDVWISKALAYGPLVFIGAISYGMYLFHPLFLRFMYEASVFYGIRHQKVLAPAALFLTVLFSWASFKWWETPIILWGRRRLRDAR